jgi:hypothetical protein
MRPRIGRTSRRSCAISCGLDPGRATGPPGTRIHSQMRTVFYLTLFSFMLCAFAQAQQAGSRDLTISWRAPEDHVAPPSSSCDQVNSTVARDSQPAKPPSINEKGLQLTIAQIAPPELTNGADFTATVRLKNIGTSKVLVPWQPDGEQATRVSQDGKEERYEVADVTFRLKTGNKSRAPMFLDSQGALFANPDDPATYLELTPGRWVDIKLKGTVECGLPECPVRIHPDDHAILTAWWYQRVLTHKVEGCNENHGSNSVRELDSAPFSVVVRASSAPDQKQE